MATISSPTSDPLLETQMFWVRYKTAILGGLLAMILAIAAYGGYYWHTSHQNAAAAALLAQAKGAADYEKLIKEYPSATAAPSAYLLLAAVQRKEQKLAEANTTLKAFIDKNPKHELVTTAKMAMAANIEAIGKPDEALEMYRRLAADYPRSFNAPLAMLAEVPLLKAKGDVEGARRVCETVLTQYRDSYVAAEATRHLRMLKPPPSSGAVSEAPALTPDQAALEQAASATAAAPIDAPATSVSPTASAAPSP